MLPSLDVESDISLFRISRAKPMPCSLEEAKDDNAERDDDPADMDMDGVVGVHVEPVLAVYPDIIDVVDVAAGRSSRQIDLNKR